MSNVLGKSEAGKPAEQDSALEQSPTEPEVLPEKNSVAESISTKDSSEVSSEKNKSAS
jgi:hypothetical protein